jgi:hypothetical protein
VTRGRREMPSSKRQRSLNIPPTEDESTVSVKASVGEILTRQSVGIIEEWLERTKRSHDLDSLRISDAERIAHLPRLIEDLCIRLRRPELPMRDGDSPPSRAARVHGKLRYQQSYTAAMLVQESRILLVTLFGTLEKNLSSLDFKLLVTDIMIIADEVDAQLSEAMTSYMEALAPKVVFLMKLHNSSQAR